MLNPLTYITLFTLVLLRSLGGVILFQLCYFHYPVLPFVTKRGSNFYLDRECISKQVK